VEKYCQGKNISFKILSLSIMLLIILPFDKISPIHESQVSSSRHHINPPSLTTAGHVYCRIFAQSLMKLTMVNMSFGYPIAFASHPEPS
jgi:hypothetical protein